MDTKIGLESKRVNDRDVGSDGVERGALLLALLHHVASPTREDVVDGSDRIRWALDLNIVDGLHEAGGRREEGGIGHSERCEGSKRGS